MTTSDATLPTRDERGPRARRATSLCLAPGQLVNNKYLLERELDRGGFSSVWLARNLVLGNEVAVKFLTAWGSAPVSQLRLRNEAQLLAHFRHPHLVKVLDIGVTEDGTHFLVMEFLEGMTLRQCLQEVGPMSPIEAVRLMLPVLDGLRLVHRGGIVHRDLKPENIFLSPTRGCLVPKLLDFGVAVASQQDFSERLTRDGAIVGSPHYLSPEQAQGQRDIDAKSDVWGVCVVLYECLTAARPFDAEGFQGIVRAIATESPDPLRLPGPAAVLESIIFKGLAKSRDERWPSSCALGVALASWLSEQGVHDDVSGQSLAALWLGSGTLDESFDLQKLSSRPEAPTAPLSKGSDRANEP